MHDPGQQLENEVRRFQAWVRAHPEPVEKRAPEWEQDCEGWPALYAALASLAADVPCQDWSQTTAEQVVCAMAHDTDQRGLIRELARHPDTLLCQAERACALQEPAAKWQIAAELGKLDTVLPAFGLPMLLAIGARVHPIATRSCRTPHAGAISRVIVERSATRRILTHFEPFPAACAHGGIHGTHRTRQETINAGALWDETCLGRADEHDAQERMTRDLIDGF